MPEIDRRLAPDGYMSFRGDREPYEPLPPRTGRSSVADHEHRLNQLEATVHRQGALIEGICDHIEAITEGRLGAVQAHAALVKLLYPKPPRLPPAGPGAIEQPKSLTYSGWCNQRVESGTEALSSWTANLIDSTRIGVGAGGVLTVNDPAALVFYLSGKASPALDLITSLPISIGGALELRIERLVGMDWETIPNGATRITTPLQISDYPVGKQVGISTAASAQFRVVAEVEGLLNAVELVGLEWGVLVAPPPAAA